MYFYLGYAVLLLFCFYSFPMVIFSWLSQSNRWLTINPCTLVAHLVKNPPAMWETWVWSLVWKIPWRREWLLTPVLWPGKFQLQRVGHDWAIFTFHCFCAYENSIVLLTQERPSLVAQWLKKKKNLPAMQETQFPSLGQEDPLEEEMATHSSILVWEIPWTGQRSLVGYSPWCCKRVIT